MLIKPNRGTRNQKNGSVLPKISSFCVKSRTDSVALWCQLRSPPMAGWCAFGPVLTYDIPKMVTARNSRGIDVNRHCSMLLEKLMKTPIIVNQCHTDGGSRPTSFIIDLKLLP